MELLTPTGYKRIEDFKPGDLIISRSESDPDGPLEVKEVEAVFVRVALLTVLQVCGRIIRTTGEHPFFVLDKGWVRGCPKRKRGDKMKGRKDFCERITRYNSWFSHREKRTKRT
jgi:intein/homing endonuclease